MEAKELPEYQYSKQAALEASRRLLRRRCLVPQAASSGDPLALDRWFLSSLSTHNFLLAAMIVYLNVMNDIKDPHSTTSNDIRGGLDMLEMSCKNWEATLALTPETTRAHRGLVAMVDKAHRALGRQPPTRGNAVNRFGIESSSENAGDTSAGPDVDIQGYSFEFILSLSENFDWESFDTQIRPQSTIQDSWPDINTDFEHGMNHDYDYNTQDETFHMPRV